MTRNLPRFVLLWSGIVLGYDALAAALSLVTGIPFGWFGVGSVLLYATAGFMGTRPLGLARAVGGTMLVGAVDASLGWWVSALIGPGRIQNAELTVATVVLTGMVGAVIFAGVSSLVGGLIARD